MKTSHDTESMLIRTAQAGDPDAFNLLVLNYQDMMYRIALRIIQEECGAEDATQNAVIQAFQNICTFRGGSFKSWLARVAVNASYDELRRNKRHNNLPLEQFNQDGDEIESPLWMLDPAIGPEEATEANELQRAMQNCIRDLSPDFRLMVILVDVEGMSYEEAAWVARVPVGTVKSRLARARMQLRDALQKIQNLLPSAYQMESAVFA